MKEWKLGSSYISFFCMELYLAIQAGISVDEGVGMLREEEKDARVTELLTSMYDKMQLGEELNSVMRECGGFPKYVVDMVEIGERTGNLDSTLKALSEYYDRQEQISKSVKNAIMYPAILLVMMLVVVVVLITQVLPIFGDVFSQLGSTMNGFSLALMNIGIGLRDNWAIVLGVAAVIVLAVAIWLRGEKQRAKFADFGFSKKIGAAVACSRFASAMAMTMQSGLDVDESVGMAERLTQNPGMLSKIADLKKHMEEGESFAESVAAAKIFSNMYGRMLVIGFKAGAADSAMSEIARRTGEEAEDSIERLIGRVEPTLVIIMSVIVGAILLSVMLPLMGVMSGIGA